MKIHHPVSRPRGFSLFELLMVLSILGIMFSLVLPMAYQTNDIKQSRDRRNAQELSALCTCAQIAGVDFVIHGDVRATVRNVCLGGAPTEGVFKGRRFVVTGMTDDDITNSERFLSVENGNLVYHYEPRR